MSIDPRLSAPIICLIGLITYLALDGKPSQVGLWTFGIGLFVTLWKGMG